MQEEDLRYRFKSPSSPPEARISSLGKDSSPLPPPPKTEGAGEAGGMQSPSYPPQGTEHQPPAQPYLWRLLSCGFLKKYQRGAACQLPPSASALQGLTAVSPLLPGSEGGCGRG